MLHSRFQRPAWPLEAGDVSSGPRRPTLCFSSGRIRANKPQTPKAKSSPVSASVETANTSRLPVKRVVLCKNGIGYFEHTARVHGNQDLSIDFTTGPLNDVLKSLTVVGLGQGRIGSVRYNSIAPLDERLRGLRLPFGETVSSAEYLTALRGARVDVRSGTSSAKRSVVDRRKRT